MWYCSYVSEHGTIPLAGGEAPAVVLLPGLWVHSQIWKDLRFWRLADHEGPKHSHPDVGIL